MISNKQKALDSIKKSIRRKKYSGRFADTPNKLRVPTETNLETGNLKRRNT